MEFKKGDKVIATSNNIPETSYDGMIAIVREVDSTYEFPYWLRFENGDSLWCTAVALTPLTEVLC